jgi:PhnB protein
MAEMKLNPYIARDGDTREMLEYYHGLLGGKIDLQTYGESPMPTPDSHKDRILHGRVDVGDVTIMAADAPPNMPLSSTNSNISLSLIGTDEAKQFWGDMFGMVDDKYGTHWMVDVEAGEGTKEA